jgi:hypothetical protein
MKIAQLRLSGLVAALVAAFSLAGSARAQAAAAPDASDGFYDDAALVRLLELGLTDNRVEEPLRYLSKEIGPRLTGSTNLQRAAQWAEERFAALGLDARLW